MDQRQQEVTVHQPVRKKKALQGIKSKDSLTPLNMKKRESMQALRRSFAFLAVTMTRQT
jgi:hypothetical protein